MDAPGVDSDFSIDDATNDRHTSSSHDEQFYDTESTRPPMPDAPPPSPYQTEYQDHSLPTPEDAINIAAFRGLPHRQKRNLCLFVAAVLGLTAIIGFSAGISVSNRNKAAASKSTTSSEGPVAGGGATTQEQVDRLKDVKDFLSSFSSRNDLETDGTPQALAAQWIAVDDQRQVAVPASTDYADSFAFVQRYVLAVFYYTLDGGNWKFASQARFLSSSSECKWNFGLTAPTSVPGGDKTKWRMGATCNDQGEVNQIFLPYNDLAGPLPSELNLLPQMEHFSVFGNAITGTLPDLSAWQALTFFAAESNQLTGPLGDWFYFPKLQYLALGDNAMTGPLPSFDWATDLTEVSLSNNVFTGSVDVFNGATSLEVLYLQYNSFTGPISNATFADLTLTDLDISENFLTGYFPQHFYKFQVVDLHNNSLSGELPFIKYAGRPLTFLSLYQNQFSGHVPDSFGFLYHLAHLDLSENQFSGYLTNVFDEMVKLEYLFLHRNNFTAGRIPDLWKVTNLKELSLKGTHRKGTIPSWLGSSLTELVLLDLHDNQLEGTIPANFGDMTNMRFLFLNDNQLNGTIPDTFSSLTDLAMFTIHRNELTGDATPICDDTVGLAYFVADCQEIDCKCCSDCCNDSDPNCNKLELSPSFDGGYNRTKYIFSENLQFKVQP